MLSSLNFLSLQTRSTDVWNDHLKWVSSSTIVTLLKWTRAHVSNTVKNITNLAVILILEYWVPECAGSLVFLGLFWLVLLTGMPFFSSHLAIWPAVLGCSVWFVPPSCRWSILALLIATASMLAWRGAVDYNCWNKRRQSDSKDTYEGGILYPPSHNYRSRWFSNFCRPLQTISM